jgi:hypothetical protein
MPGHHSTSRIAWGQFSGDLRNRAPRIRREGPGDRGEAAQGDQESRGEGRGGPREQEDPYCATSQVTDRAPGSFRGETRRREPRDAGGDPQTPDVTPHHHPSALEVPERRYHGGAMAGLDLPGDIGITKAVKDADRLGGTEGESGVEAHHHDQAPPPARGLRAPSWSPSALACPPPPRCPPVPCFPASPLPCSLSPHPEERGKEDRPLGPVRGAHRRWRVGGGGGRRGR